MKDEKIQMMIVDDQTSVVQGLLCGVNWEALGISKIYEAYNAFEAREVLLQDTVDILLCDIEMPAESGLELLNWIREMKMDLECIFLTAHAEFDYARKAVSMQSFDYIVQPAPYEDIAKTVGRAVVKVREKRREASVLRYGKVLSENDYHFAEQIFGDYLEHRISSRQYEKYTELGEVPGLDQTGYLVTFRILSWEKDVSDFSLTFLEDILGNMIGEMLMPFDQRIVLCGLSRETYVFVTYGRSGYIMDADAIKRQLLKAVMKLEEVVRLTAAFYYREAEHVSAMTQTYVQLMRAMKRNVAGRMGVFCIDESEKNHSLSPNGKLPGGTVFSKWAVLLQQGMIEVVRKEICEYLDFYADRGKLDDMFLLRMYMEFNRMFYLASENSPMRLYDIFADEDEARVFEQAYISVNQMKEYTGHVLDYLRDHAGFAQEQGNHIEQVKRYIHENVDKDIRREDIAETVHLNEDYLSRLFKKTMGISLKEYINAEKISVARQMIRTTALPISVIALKTGYTNYSHFSKNYKKVTGISPTEERKRERSETEQ